MEQAMEWLARYERYWTEQLDRLAAFSGGRSMATKPSLVLKRRLKAARKSLPAWTQPEQMTRWWGVAGNPKPTIAETDLRVGGRFRVQYWGTNDEHHSVSGHLSRGRAQPEALLLVGVADHAGTRIAGHDRAQPGH
jgi:hypothetical protein